jgi:L-threonylcarbamoyladenylate synthase
MNNREIPVGKENHLADSPRQVTATAQVVDAAEPGAIKTAASALLRGELVLFPTDTVYGIAANAFNEQAIHSLFIAKQRERTKGIPVLIADVVDLEKVIRDIPAIAEDLITRFWPGPLTIVLPKQETLPPPISNTSTVAVRMPDHELCRAIIRSAGGAVAATSANISGRDPAHTINEALFELAGSVSVAVDGGNSGGQVASTVVDVADGTIRILRRGPLMWEDLVEAVRL